MKYVTCSVLSWNAHCFIRKLWMLFFEKFVLSVDYIVYKLNHLQNTIKLGYILHMSLWMTSSLKQSTNGIQLVKTPQFCWISLCTSVGSKSCWCVLGDRQLFPFPAAAIKWNCAIIKCLVDSFLYVQWGFCIWSFFPEKLIGVPTSIRNQYWALGHKTAITFLASLLKMYCAQADF